VKTITTLIFDFGKVITMPPDESQFEVMRGLIEAAPRLPGGSSAAPRGSAIGLEDLVAAYSGDRQEYDRGSYSPAEYWARVGAALGRQVEGLMVERLRAADIACWFTFDPEMLALLRSLRTRVRSMALLSNINFDGVEALRARADWLGLFNALVLSCEHRIVKPDPSIYALCLERLGALPEDCLFVDDTEVNVRAAREAGINAHLYRGGAGLEAELGGCYRLSL
jgi:putative hydrolase of the HAD superfamily